MVSYPVHIPMSKKLAKQLSPGLEREYRKRVQDYLNERARKSPEIVLIYPDIASDTRLDTDTIRLFLKPLTGSYGGITIVNPELKADK